MLAAFEAGVAELGPGDIVLANAGIAPMSLHETHGAWQDVIDVNLTGVFNTVETAIPSMIERGAGGAIVLTDGSDMKLRFGRVKSVTELVGPAHHKTLREPMLRAALAAWCSRAGVVRDPG